MPPLAPAVRRSTGYPMKTEMRRSCLLFFLSSLASKPRPWLTLACMLQHLALHMDLDGLLRTVPCTAYRSSTTLYFPSDISSEMACLSSFPAGAKFVSVGLVFPSETAHSISNAACRLEKVQCIQPHRFLRDLPVHANPIQYPISIFSPPQAERVFLFPQPS
jgi:hypothetical protein